MLEKEFDALSNYAKGKMALAEFFQKGRNNRKIFEALGYLGDALQTPDLGNQLESDIFGLMAVASIYTTSFESASQFNINSQSCNLQNTSLFNKITDAHFDVIALINKQNQPTPRLFSGKHERAVADAQKKLLDTCSSVGQAFRIQYRDLIMFNTLDFYLDTNFYLDLAMILHRKEIKATNSFYSSLLNAPWGNSDTQLSIGVIKQEDINQTHMQVKGLVSILK